MSNRPKRTAFLSLWDKKDIAEIAGTLHRLGFDIWASGGTATAIGKLGIPVTDLATKVGEAILKHRVVTLSREFHGALLATGSDADIADLEKLGMPRIDLVFSTFYPFEETIAKPDVTVGEAIESIDIGGPTMRNSAAKGGRIVVDDLEHFRGVASVIESVGFMEGNPIPPRKIFHWSAMSFLRVSDYYSKVAEHLYGVAKDDQGNIG